MTAGPTARTTIVDSVVARIALLAAAEAPGVVALRGSPPARGRATARIEDSSTFRGPGVVCEVGPYEVAIDLVLVAAEGVALPTLASDVTHLGVAVDAMTGLRVVRVDIHVVDLEPSAPDVGVSRPSR